MFTEILNIVPKASGAALNTMERALNSRFAKIAKKFGKAVSVAAAAGGGLAIAFSMLDKVLNPLKETQEAIDKTLAKADGIVNNAEQFGTSAGTMLNLQALANARGLDNEGLATLIQKFQSAVADAAQDPSKPSAVRQFVGEKDMATAFFNFTDQLKKMDPTQQNLIQQEVFGERQILKMAEFMRTKDFQALGKTLGLKSASTGTAAVTKVADLEDKQSELATKTSYNDLFKKASLINDKMITSQNVAAQRELDLENDNLSKFDSLAITAKASQEILINLQMGITKLTDILVKVTKVSGVVESFSKSTILKRFLGGGDGK